MWTYQTYMENMSTALKPDEISFGVLLFRQKLCQFRTFLKLLPHCHCIGPLIWISKLKQILWRKQCRRPCRQPMCWVKVYQTKPRAASSQNLFGQFPPYVKPLEWNYWLQCMFKSKHRRDTVRANMSQFSENEWDWFYHKIHTRANSECGFPEYSNCN